MNLNEVVNGTYEQRLRGYIQRAKFQANNSKLPVETIRAAMAKKYGDNTKNMTVADIANFIMQLEQK